MAVLMSLMALAIDAMLPALDLIGLSLGVNNPNDNQLIISTLFLGMALGLMLYGPISDSYGRKITIYLGVGIFLIGDLISLLSEDFTFMIIGRLLQGFGAAACRVITIAMIRDRFDGPKMAKVMSLIMMVFIMVPVLAPSVGQVILLFSSWRAIFLLLLAYALVGSIWLHFRQPETLAKEKRLPFSLKVILQGIAETIKHPQSRTYTIAAGIMFGAFIGYLSSSQQILQNQYELGNAFSLYFGFLALAIGMASFANSKLVMLVSMEKLCVIALGIISVLSLLFYFYAKSFTGHPPLMAFMAYLSLTFFCFGVLFGNFNTLALHPLGHIAGVATSVISTLQTLLSVGVGYVVGQAYDGSVIPLVEGFLVCSTLTLLLMAYVLRLNKYALSTQA
jgi:DHA1 family bicyclomycin/chloramphenicol resistance-like MFS transporter